MSNYRYILEPYKGMKTKFRCPSCRKNKEFTRYIDLDADEYLSDEVGICSNKIKCGYHYPPKDYFKDNDFSTDFSNRIKRQPPKPKPEPTFIDAQVMERSKEKTSANYFIDFLSNHWNKETADYLADKYHVGTSKHWKGANVFWQVDENNKIRSGKIMLYNPSNGKRVKEPKNYINWAHCVLKLANFELEQCYFGTHLLNEDKSKPVAIVESEKTAIICSVYLPEFIWIACGSVSNLNKNKTKILRGRNVVLFPDLKCYDLWNDKIPELTSLANFRTSRLLEDKATKQEREQGLDLADYLLKINT
jgi:hypothetical protein